MSRIAFIVAEAVSPVQLHRRYKVTQDGHYFKGPFMYESNARLCAQACEEDEASEGHEDRDPYTYAVAEVWTDDVDFTDDPGPGFMQVYSGVLPRRYPPIPKAC